MSQITALGAEVEVTTVAGGPDGQASSAGLTRDTTANKRTGVACYKADTTSVSTAYLDTGVTISGAAVRYFARVYFKITNMPGSDVNIIQIGGPGNICCRLKTTGELVLLTDGFVIVGSPSSALSTGTWYCVELMALTNAGVTQFTEAELRLDGSTVASSTSLTVSKTGSSFLAGWIDNPGSGKVLYMDDIAINTDTGGVNDTWLGEGKVLWMKPTSDSQRGSWTGGAGGTTNLWDALNNTPPVGTATETNLTQIESADSSGDNATDEYRGDCGSYTTAGVGAGDTVVFVQPWCNHGEDVATNTKTGSFGPQSNPSNTYDTFTFGNDVGALGTYPTNWTWTRGTKNEMPTITPGNSLILAIRKTDTGTRVASVDSLGAYVSVSTPPANLSKSGTDANNSTTESASVVFSAAVSDTDGTQTETGAVTVPIAGSDASGGTTNTGTLTAVLPGTDASNTITEASSLSSAIPASDVDGTQTETGSLTATIPGSDIDGTQTEVGSVTVPISGSDTSGPKTESGTLIAAIPGSDVDGTQTETGTLVAQIPGSDVDGSNPETGSLTAQIPASDSTSPAVEVGTPTVPVSGSDVSGAASEASALAASIPSSDVSAGGLDVAVLAAQLSGTDVDGSNPETGTLAAAIPGTDVDGTASETTSATAIITATDVDGTTVEVGSAQAPGTPSGTDSSGGVTEGTTLSAAIPSSDADGTAVEAAQATAPVSGSDTGAGTDAGLLSAQVLTQDASSTQDLASLVASLVASDTGAGVDASSVTYAIKGTDASTAVLESAVLGSVQIVVTDNAASLEAALLSVVLGGVDAGVAADVAFLMQTLGLQTITAVASDVATGATLFTAQPEGKVSNIDPVTGSAADDGDGSTVGDTGTTAIVRTV